MPAGDKMIMGQKGVPALIHVLIVEDEKPIADLIRLSLTKEGFCCTCAQDGAQAAEALEDYIAARAGAFTGYAPEQAAILAHSTAVSRGRYAALLICSDPAEARAAFNACFEGPPAEEPPVPLAPRPQEPPVSGEEEQDGGWRYDRQRLLSAWEEGGTGLADRDQVILQSCRDLLGEIITEEMSDYEKELAVHDWMIAWAEYDQAALSALPGAQPTPDSDNPYGFFTGRAAICTGYTSTFQLLMDLLGIECVTVEGTAYNGTEDHAWNMVRLDGDWYCVDVTWDDPVMGEEIFGPILPILTWKSLGEVVETVQSHPSPLALYIFSSDKRNIETLKSHISFGGGCVNDTIIHLATSEMGFGGFGESGMGAYHGKAGFDTFSHNKSIVDKKTWLDLPMRYQPYKKFHEKLVRFFLK